MFVVGLTGGIASGKSTVARILQEQGAAIIDADKLTKELQQPHTPVWDEIVRRFGSGVLLNDDTLNRKKLAEIVFKDKNALTDLENIVHPRVIDRVQERIVKLELPGQSTVAVIDAPLLIEAKMTGLVDEVWVVSVPEETQVKRLIARDALTAEQAAARIRSQMSLADKLRYADRVIDSSGTIEETRQRVYHEWQGLLHKIAQRTHRRANND
ncbi:MAG TPA: dephospho-CoA kinase [Desulfobacteria bacterium]|nr:dephospho-CoA kinase [Desulfobacteria bacterium]